MTDKQYEIITRIVESFSLKMTGIPSLSEMATCMKTSKQALYRYFKSKDELTAALTEYTDIQLNGMRESLSGFAGFSVEERIKALLCYLKDKTFLAMTFILTKETRNSFYCFYFPEYANADDICFGLLSAAIFSSGKYMMADDFLTDLPPVISSLLDGITELSDIQEPVIPKVEARTAEILKQHPQDRFYKAISQIAYKCPMTTKALSEELGLAPSTLYSHYRNKKELIDSVSRNEIMRFVAVLNETRKSFRTEAEQLIACYCTTRSFIGQGGSFSANLLQYGIRKNEIEDEQPLLTDKELYLTLAAVYCSGLDTRKTISYLAKGLNKVEI